jgi:hypothetical protein
LPDSAVSRDDACDCLPRQCLLLLRGIHCQRHLSRYLAITGPYAPRDTGYTLMVVVLSDLVDDKISVIDSFSFSCLEENKPDFA